MDLRGDLEDQQPQVFGQFALYDVLSEQRLGHVCLGVTGERLEKFS